MRRVCALLAVIGGCFFPSLDGLSGPSDGGVDAPHDVFTVDASDGGLCPPNNDPTLVAYYPFDEGSGDIAHDCSGHGFDAVIEGTDAGSVWTKAGHTGDAISFVPANGTCVIVASPSANQSGGPLTAAAWVFPVDPVYGYIVGQRHQAGYAWRIDVEPIEAGPGLNFAVGLNSDGGNDETVFTVIQGGAWHHVAAVFDPSGPTQAIYLDGVKTPDSTPASVIVPDPIASTIRIGCRGDESYFWNGLIDEVRVYSRALSDAEITALAK
jgi:hypothetical protein